MGLHNNITILWVQLLNYLVPDIFFNSMALKLVTATICNYVLEKGVLL